MDTNNALIENLIDDYSSLLLREPYHVKYLTIRGLLWESLCNYELALLDFNKLIKLGEKKAYYLRAYLYCRLGEINLVINDLNTKETHGIQSSCVSQYIAFITKRRAKIIEEIEAECLRNKLMEKFNNVDFAMPN